MAEQGGGQTLNCELYCNTANSRITWHLLRFAKFAPATRLEISDTN